jgi:NAD(P)-dependent dehydrogenase (short-subunit alcohol dehydrogenase family)
MNRFAPEVAVIAGVGPGLGGSLARRFAKEGCRVALLARSPGFIETQTQIFDLSLGRTQKVACGTV